ncbi:hypothetical protein GCM10009730_50140 [Streptomyces albidochromogenes]
MHGCQSAEQARCDGTDGECAGEQAARNPPMDAHGLHFCRSTSQTALAILYRRFDLAAPDDLRARPALDMLVAAFKCALDDWAPRLPPRHPPRVRSAAGHVNRSPQAVGGRPLLRPARRCR